MLDDSLIGQQLANFRIERPLGRGGMAQVYYGQDVKLDRPVAIKLIDARHRQNPAYAERFVREAQAVAKWRHEHIVQIYYADDQDGLYYFIMEFVDGQNLDEILAEYQAKHELMPQAQVLHIIRALATALDYAHQQGVIHRDVKPANLMVSKEGRVILMDFGLAMDVEQGSIGEVFGSTKYIAPEQARRSSDAVPQSDLYACGVILYEMLTGRLPFDDPSPTALAIQHLTMEPPRPREFNPHLSEELEAVILKALQKAPEQRYQTGQALIEALETALNAATEIIHPAAPTPNSPTPNLDSIIGQTLDEYRLEKLLGQGGMARVYLGIDINLDRRVAIKVIDTPYRDDETYETRFKREAKAIAQLEHPHIVRLYRYGKASGLLYIAMQYIEGQNLQAKLSHYRNEDQYMPVVEIHRIIAAVCQALDYAHSKGVIHRDIKPSNIMLNEREEVFLADFGLALLQDIGTRGEILGSPHYIAPEQAMSSAGVVTQSDLYAVGVILFHMVTNSLPFTAAEPLDIAMLHITEPPPAPSSLRSNISPELEAVVLKSLAKKPTERYATGAELVAALEQALALEAPTPNGVALPTPPPPPTPTVPIETPPPPPVAPPPSKPTPTASALPTLPPIPAVIAARQDNQATTKTPSILTKIAENAPASGHSRLSVAHLKERGLMPYALAAGVLLFLACAGAYMFWGNSTDAPTIAAATLTPTVTATEEAAAFEPPTATVVPATATHTPLPPTPTDTPTPLPPTPTDTPTVPPTATPDPNQNQLGYLALWRSVATGTISARSEKWFTFNTQDSTNGSIVVFVRNNNWLDMVVYDGGQIPRWPPAKPDEIPNAGLGNDRDLDGNQYTKEVIWDGNFVPNAVFYVRLINRLNQPVEYCVATRSDAKRCP